MSNNRLSDEDLKDILSDDDAWPSCAEAHEMARELIELRALCGEVYQVVGVLAHQANVFSAPEIERAMNNLVAAINGSPLPHETLLPFGVKAAGSPLPKMPELRWDGDDLFLGDLHVGHVLVDPSLGKTWVGFLTHDASPETSVCCWTDEASARSAVEAEVRKALGWEA